MATVNSVNYARTQANPSDRIDPGELGGRLKCLKDSYVYAVALAINTEIDSIKLPKGALVIDGYIHATTGSGAGKISMGFRANDDDSEDLDAFVVENDFGAAEVFARSGVAPANEDGILKRFDSETQVALKVTEASTATSGTVSWCLFYLID